MNNSQKSNKKKNNSSPFPLFGIDYNHIDENQHILIQKNNLQMTLPKAVAFLKPRFSDDYMHQINLREPEFLNSTISEEKITNLQNAMQQIIQNSLSNKTEN